MFGHFVVIARTKLYVGYGLLLKKKKKNEVIRFLFSLSPLPWYFFFPHLCILLIWIIHIRHFTHVFRIENISDMGAGAICVRYASDTPTDISEYSNNFDMSRYVLIRPDTPLICSWYVHDIFSKYFDGFSQEYAPNIRRYAPILLRYILEWNLYHVFCVPLAFKLFIYQ
jgi:hypothetical protein